MKAGPVVAMLLLIALGMWLVLQPALSRARYDMAFTVGAEQVLIGVVEFEGADGGVGYRVVAPERLVTADAVSPGELMSLLERERAAWERRPAIERTLLGFFNITSWWNFGWVVVGLVGQAAFFGRMLVQWVISEKSRRSQVPELFWWLSFSGGVCLFTYFVWRVDVVGVVGQSTGVVIYARNLRLIYKEKQRVRHAGTGRSASDASGKDA